MGLIAVQWFGTLVTEAAILNFRVFWVLSVNLMIRKCITYAIKSYLSFESYADVYITFLSIQVSQVVICFSETIFSNLWICSCFKCVWICFIWTLFWKSTIYSRGTAYEERLVDLLSLCRNKCLNFKSNLMISILRQFFSLHLLRPVFRSYLKNWVKIHVEYSESRLSSRFLTLSKRPS